MPTASGSLIPPSQLLRTSSCTRKASVITMATCCSCSTSITALTSSSRKTSCSKTCLRCSQALFRDLLLSSSTTLHQVRYQALFRAATRRILASPTAALAPTRARKGPAQAREERNLWERLCPTCSLLTTSRSSSYIKTQPNK